MLGMDSYLMYHAVTSSTNVDRCLPHFEKCAAMGLDPNDQAPLIFDALGIDPDVDFTEADRDYLIKTVERMYK